MPIEALGPPTIVLFGNRREDPTFAQRATSRARVLQIDVPHPAPWRSPVLPFASLLLDFPNEYDTVRRAVIGLTQGTPPAAIVSQNEQGLVPAQQLSRDLRPDLPDDLEAAQLLRDKHRMRMRLAEAGFSNIGYRCGNSARDMAAFLAEYLDAIVKPINGVASRGVVRVKSAAQIEAAVAVQRAVDPGPFLMEEYLEGPEFSVESFSFDGDHRVIAITQKTTLASTFVEIGHVVPAPIDEAAQRAIVDCVVSFLRIVGLKNGPAHTELRMTAHGPRIIESQNRVGGDRISLLVKAVYGLDLLDLAFDWALRRVPPLRVVPQACGAAAVRYFVPRPGVLQSVTGFEELDATPNVLDWEFTPHAGDRIRVPVSSFHRAGFVVARGENAGDAVRNAELAGAKLKLTIGPADGRAAAPAYGSVKT